MHDRPSPSDTRPADITADLEAFRRQPKNANLFSKLQRALKNSGDRKTLAEIGELRASASPQDARAAKLYSDAAEQWMHAGEVHNFESALRKAIAIAPAEKQAAPKLIDHLVSHNRFAEAAVVGEAEVTELERLSGSDDGSRDPLTVRLANRHAFLAQLWGDKLGRVERALHHWQRAWQLDPGNTDALRAARDIYASLGTLEMVSRLYEAELELTLDGGTPAEQAEVQLALGELCAKQDNLDGAIEYLEAAHTREPGSDKIREKLATLYVQIGDDPTALEKASKLFVELGRQHARNSNFDSAATFFRRALGANPYSSTAAEELEAIFTHTQRFEELERLYEQRAALTDNDEEHLLWLEKRAHLYREDLERLPSRIEVLTELSKVGEFDNAHSQELAALLRNSEKWELLAEHLAGNIERLDEAHPHKIQLLLELATVQRESLQNRDHAARLIHQVLQLRPGHAEALERYADHFRERRDWRGLADLTEFALDSAIASGADVRVQARYLEEIAQLSEIRLGDIDRSIAAWQRLKETDPSNTKANEALKRLMSKAKMWQSLIGVLEEEATNAPSPAARAEALRRIATTYRERQVQPRQAIELYEQVIEIEPHDESSLAALLELYDREGDNKGIAHTLRRQLDFDSLALEKAQGKEFRDWPVSMRMERLNALRRLATMYEEELDDADGVVFAGTAILEMLPADRDALSRMERMLEKAEDWEPLENTLNYHLESATGPAEQAKIVRRLAQLAASRGDEVVALEHWERLLALVPTDDEGQGALASLYEAAERWGELAAVLEGCVVAQLAPTPGTTQAAGHAEEIRRFARVVDDKLGDRTRATRAWQGLLALQAKDREALDALARLYEDAGSWRDLAQVLARLVTARRDINPVQAAELALKRASILEERLGAPSDAISALEDLIANIAPANLNAHRALRRLFEAVGNIEGAVRTGEREMFLLDDDDKRIGRGLEIGFLCRDRLGDSARAMLAFERVLELAPDHPEACIAATELCAQLEDWPRHARMLERQIERTESGRPRRSLLSRLGKVTADKLGDPKKAFEWLHKAHTELPDSTSLADLRSAAKEYSLWPELAGVFEDQRAGIRSGEMSNAGRLDYVELSRQLATLLDQHLGDPDRAMDVLCDALSFDTANEALIADAERIAGAADRGPTWKLLCDCFELAMSNMPRRTKIALLLERSRIHEQRLRDPQGAMDDLANAFAWSPERDDIRAHITQLASKTEDWSIPIAVEMTRYERASSLPSRLSALRRASDLIETKSEDLPLAFRVHLSAFLEAPEDGETVAHLWRLARTIGKYPANAQQPQAMPAPAKVHPGPIPTRARRPSQAVSFAKRDTTMEIVLDNLVEEAPRTQIPRGDRTQPIDLQDIDFDDIGSVGDSTQPIDLADLMEQAAPPPVPATTPSIAPPPTPPRTPATKNVLPTLPPGRFRSAWDELANAYESLPTHSPAMRLRWLFKSAEVQDNGAGNFRSAFDTLESALTLSGDKTESRARLYQLAEAHNQWDRLADIFSKLAESADKQSTAIQMLTDIASIRVRQRRPLETEALYRRVLGMDPEHEQARSNLEQLYRDENRYIDLAAALEERTDPRFGTAAPAAERPTLLRELAEVYDDKLGRVHDAIDSLIRLRELSPEDTSVLEHLAELNRKIGRWSKVIDNLHRLTELEPGQERAREAMHQIADIYENKLELHDRAIDALVELTAAWPDDAPALEALDRLYLSLGRWEPLSQVLRRRAAQATTTEMRAELLVRRAGILTEWLNSHDEAAAALRHARTLLPDDATIADKLIDALLASNREREGASVLEDRIRILETQEDHSRSPGVLAALYIRLATISHNTLDDSEAAETSLSRALQLVPDHPSALATRALIAEKASDPRDYAMALAKQANAETDVDTKVTALLAVGVAWRDRVNDLNAARSVFEQILELRPYHAEATWALSAMVERGGDIDSAAQLLENRLADEGLSSQEKAAIHTQLAALSRQANIDIAAQRHLKSAIEFMPTFMPAIIAESDLLSELEHYSELASFLDSTIPLVEDSDAPVRAELLRRQAQNHEKLGDADQAYQTLLKADRLDRGNLLVKLGLGENRYRARRWREAALHLSTLAEHTAATRYPAEVAEGLFHAALAEIRSLRPERAEALYERAVELKPNYAPALHALAELAMEQGNSRRAADLLTRQATSTDDPDERLRMFEALGDMAKATLADPERARICYEAAVKAATPLEAKHLPLLEKLASQQTTREDFVGLARTAELLASFADTPEDRAEQWLRSASNLRLAGKLDRAREAAWRAATAAPRFRPAALLASELAMANEDYERSHDILGRALAGSYTTDDTDAEATLWSRWGRVKRANKDRKGAIAALEKAVSIGDNSASAMEARRELLSIWDESEETRSQLVEYHRTLAVSSQTRDDIVAYGNALAASGNSDGSHVMLSLAEALGHKLSAQDNDNDTSHLMRVFEPDEAYNAPLSPEHRRVLLSEPDFEPMAEVLRAVSEASALLWPDQQKALESAGVGDANRLGAKSTLPAAAVYNRVSKALGTPPVRLFASDDKTISDVQIVCASPPLVVIGPALQDTSHEAATSTALRFALGRAAELARPEYAIAVGLGPVAFAELITRITRVFGADDESESSADKELRTTLPLRIRERLRDVVERASGADLDPAGYLDFAQRAADRAGYLLCGDVTPAAIARGSDGLGHLAEMALSPTFLKARLALGVGVTE